MEIQEMLDILEKIRICIKNDSLNIAKDFVNLEIENLKGITEKKCQNNKYAYEWYCSECNNLNCSNRR